MKNIYSTMLFHLFLCMINVQMQGPPLTKDSSQEKQIKGTVGHCKHINIPLTSRYS